MTTEPSDRAIVLNLLRGAVPERADEISSLWSQYGHAVEVAPSTKGVTMNADATRIQFDTKTIDLFWLFGFNAWRAIEVYLPRPRIEISGPAGVQASFDWQAARDPVTGRMATITLTNDIESY